MAKINHILFGQGKGKVGGLVLQRYEGMNIAREKPISVKNPQSTKQTQQRAKFKTASQIVAQFKEVLNTRLSTLSPYTRIRRAAAVNAIIGVTTMEQESAEALFNSVLNSINAKSMSMIDAPTLSSAGDQTINVIAANGDVVIATICNYDDDGKLMKRTVEQYTSDGTAKNFAPESGAHTFALMVVAVRANTEEGRATLSNITASSNGYSVDITRGISAGDIDVSDTVGVMGSLS